MALTSFATAEGAILTFKWLCRLTIIACLVPARAEAQQDTASANAMMPACRSSLNQDDNRLMFNQGVCIGSVRTLIFALPDLCAPREVSVAQATRVVVKYIDDRPERMHERFLPLAAEALAAAWPCRRQRK
jgi:hypothetical protein